MTLYARVVFESPLPQLDRSFDYLVPDELVPSIKVGQRVLCPFGRSKKELTGYVQSLANDSDFAGSVSEISSIVWDQPVLAPWQFDFLRAVADRQAVALGDVVKIALPNRSVRVEEATTLRSNLLATPKTDSSRQAKLVEPVVKTLDYGDVSLSAGAWIHEIIDLALSQIAEQKSSIIVVPDFRDVEQLRSAFETLGVGKLVVPYTADLSKVERYSAYLQALMSEPVIVVGTRGAVFAPVSNLGALIVWDDGDASHFEQASPYTNTRDLALMRNAAQSCALHFLAHSYSVATRRLIEIGYLDDSSQQWAKPSVAFSEGESRIDGLAYQTIRTGLAAGPVLIQVANIGVAKSAYCSDCATRAVCVHCGGTLWINTVGQLSCRICSGLNLGHQCHECKSTRIRMGRAGSTRTAAEFGRAFPGIKIVEANGQNPVASIDAAPQIVVTTPEAAPKCSEGYSAVVIIDCQVSLNRDTLVAREIAVRQWCNAIAMMRPGGKAALIGLPGNLGAQIATWNLDGFARQTLHERSEMNFPPACRIVSGTGSKSIVEDFVTKLRAIDGVESLGIAALDSASWRAVLRFPYASGQAVAQAARAFALASASVRTVNANSGRSARAISIKMDDPQVL